MHVNERNVKWNNFRWVRGTGHFDFNDFNDVFIYIFGIADMTNYLETSNRAKTYLLYSHFSLQPYLSNVNLYKFRSALTRLRVWEQRLKVKNGRWNKPRASPYHDRKCIACNKLEDEFHFMLECPLYKDIRNIYIKEYFWKYLNISKFI